MDQFYILNLDIVFQDNIIPLIYCHNMFFIYISYNIFYLYFSIFQFVQVPVDEILVF